MLIFCLRVKARMEKTGKKTIRAIPLSGGTRMVLRFFSEIKEPGRPYIQRVADIKHHIQRDRAVRRLDPAHVRPADIDRLRKLTLGKSFFLAVVGDIQTKKSKLFPLLLLHSLHSLL